MRKSISIISLLLLAQNIFFAAQVTIAERPEWQLPILEKVTFDVQTKGIEEIIDDEVATPRDYWVGFVIFSCEAKENLRKRVLWIDVEVTFSNGYKREFKGVSFYISQEGVEFDIEKIPFESKDPVSVESMLIKSIAMK